MTDITKHDVRLPPESSVQTVKEFDALVELLKVQSPIAYAQQLQNGELEAFRNKLLGIKPEVQEPVKPEVVPESVVVPEPVKEEKNEGNPVLCEECGTKIKRHKKGCSKVGELTQ